MHLLITFYSCVHTVRISSHLNILRQCLCKAAEISLAKKKQLMVYEQKINCVAWFCACGVVWEFPGEKEREIWNIFSRICHLRLDFLLIKYTYGNCKFLNFKREFYIFFYSKTNYIVHIIFFFFSGRKNAY